MRKNLLWISLSVSAFLIGCDSNNPDPNSTVPQTGKYDADVSKKAGGAPTGKADIPAGYPTEKTTKQDMKDGPYTPKTEMGKDGKDAPKDGDTKDAPKDAPKDGDKAAKADAKLSDKEIAGINKLADAKDREIALKQAVCPISDEHLGGMGAPVKVEYEGKTAFLCCDDCKKDFDKDPKAAFAKLNK